MAYGYNGYYHMRLNPGGQRQDGSTAIFLGKGEDRVAWGIHYHMRNRNPASPVSGVGRAGTPGQPSLSTPAGPAGPAFFTLANTQTDRNYVSLRQLYNPVDPQGMVQYSASSAAGITNLVSFKHYPSSADMGPKYQTSAINTYALIPAILNSTADEAVITPYGDPEMNYNVFGGYGVLRRRQYLAYSHQGYVAGGLYGWVSAAALFASRNLTAPPTKTNATLGLPGGSAQTPTWSGNMDGYSINGNTPQSIESASYSDKSLRKNGTGDYISKAALIETRYRQTQKKTQRSGFTISHFCGYVDQFFEIYASRDYVARTTLLNKRVPASGEIRMSHFYGSGNAAFHHPKDYAQSSAGIGSIAGQTAYSPGPIDGDGQGI